VPLDDGDGQRLGEQQQRCDDAPAKDAWSIEPFEIPSLGYGVVVAY
jgi:hypothetical protein